MRLAHSTANLSITLVILLLLDGNYHVFTEQPFYMIKNGEKNSL
jgi:hypothetical protein